MFSQIGSAVVQAAKIGIRSVVDFAHRDHQQKIRAQSLSLDALKRAAYNNDLHNLFEGKWPTGPDVKEKLLIPDMTIRQLVDKFATNIFTKGTAFSAADDSKTQLLSEIINTTKLNQKLFKITSEAALMGYCGLRSIWHPVHNNWVIEVKPKEHIIVESEPSSFEHITAIIIQYQFWDKDKKIKWYRERWTVEDYKLWTPIEVNGLHFNTKEPDWEKVSFTTTPNTFGEIPITLVSHRFDTQNIGQPAIRKEDIELAKALVRLKNKRHYAHLEHMDPSIAIINGSEDDDVERGVGAIIKVHSNSRELPPTVQLVEMAGVPDSVKQELMDHVTDLYKNAGLTPPTEDEQFKAGTQSSAVALRVKDEDEAKTIESLRDDGYSSVRLHLEKLLRMGARTRKLPDYTNSGINPDDPETYKVIAKFPPFFPPTPDEQQVVLSTLRQSHLSAAEKAKREAQAFLIDDQAEIEEIQSNIEAEDEMKLTTVTTGRMLSSRTPQDNSNPEGN